MRLAAVGAIGLFLPAATLGAAPAFALSEIQREDLPPAAPPTAPNGTTSPTLTVPMPNEGTKAPSEADPAEQTPGDTARPDVDPEEPLPEIVYNLDRLPEPVRRMHDLLVAAARTGEIETLRPLIGIGDDATQLSFGEVGDDPIAFLKGLSGDPDGQELLAIMEEVLGAGYVHLDAGTDEELYVWPYFFAMPLEKLTPPQKVELFRIVTAGDYEDMKQFGTYVFYRLGIDPQGNWAFFVAGD